MPKIHASPLFPPFDFIGRFFYVRSKTVPNPTDDWHLSKNLSIGIIISLVFYGLSFVWYASEMNSTVRQQGIDLRQVESVHAQDFDRLNREFASIREGSQQQAIQLVRIEENTRNLVNRMDEFIRQAERNNAVRTQP
jgi:hypothetical protein